LRNFGCELALIAQMSRVRSPTRHGRSLPVWAFGLTLAVLVGGALTGYFNARHLIGNERRVAHSDDALLDLAGLLSTLRDAERSQRGYLLIGSEAHLQRYQVAAQRVRSVVAALARETRTDPGQHARLGILRRQIGLKLAELERTISLERSGNQAAALAIVRGNASKALMDDITGQVGKMRTAEFALLGRRAGESERSSRLTVAAIVAPTLIGAALLALVFFLSRRRMIELEEADRHKDEFLALLAHELRGPLAPLRNGLELIKRTEGAEARGRAYALMERQLEQLVRLIDDLLDASRIARGKIELRLASIDLGALLREVLEVKRPLIEAASLELEISLPTQPLLVDADPVRLTQVFRNLLDNARKYTEPGGRITIHLAPERGQAVARVKDTGLGIAADKLDAIFGMFVQINRSLARSQGGLGIGLGLARRLLVLHGGSIEALSEGPGRAASSWCGYRFSRTKTISSQNRPQRPVASARQHPWPRPDCRRRARELIPLAHRSAAFGLPLRICAESAKIPRHLHERLLDDAVHHALDLAAAVGPIGLAGAAPVVGGLDRCAVSQILHGKYHAGGLGSRKGGDPCTLERDPGIDAPRRIPR